MPTPEGKPTAEDPLDLDREDPYETLGYGKRPPSYREIGRRRLPEVRETLNRSSPPTPEPRRSASSPRLSLNALRAQRAAEPTREVRTDLGDEPRTEGDRRMAAEQLAEDQANGIAQAAAGEEDQTRGRAADLDHGAPEL